MLLQVLVSIFFLHNKILIFDYHNGAYSTKEEHQNSFSLIASFTRVMLSSSSLDLVFFSRITRRRGEPFFFFFFFVLSTLLLLSVHCQRVSATSPSTYSDDLFSNYGAYGTWRLLNYTSGGPSPRLFAASTTGGILPPPYSPSDRSGFIVFGGTTNPATFEPTFNDLWVLNPEDDHDDGRTWTEITIAPGAPIPEPRCLRSPFLSSFRVSFQSIHILM